jgi:UDP-N-acetylmuramoyl-tripeptide--D-alanyl-D-alanine ligase
VSPIEIDAAWIARAVGGQVVAGDASRRANGFSIDSRAIAEGDFFIALRGPRFDGHDFVADVLRRGAAGALVRVGAGAATAAGGAAAIVEAPDTLTALHDLARAVRRAAGCVVVAITGSAGKTTTKEAIAEFLSMRHRVVKNKGNLNNHIGLPLSLLELRSRPDVAVMELGMNHAGEISALVAIAEPDVRVWTNVGDAHIGFFESQDAIAEAKAEILENAGRGAVLVCNADDPRVMARAGRFAGRVVTFGAADGASVRASAVEDLGLDGMRAQIETPQGARQIHTPLLGAGNLSNVLAATAVALELGVGLDDVVSAAARLRPAARRGAVKRLRDDIRLVDDSYNSSPSALRRALEVVAHDVHARRKVAVLGEMLELGEHALRLHDESGRRAAASGLSRLFAIGGPAAKALASAAVTAGMPASAVTWFESSGAAAEAIAPEIQAGDLVLVKGSRGVRTDIVADRIAAEHG